MRLSRSGWGGVIKLNIDAAQLSGKPISEFATPSPTALESDSKIAFALHQMDIGGYRHLPIDEGGRPVSVVSIRDILAYLAANYCKCELTAVPTSTQGWWTWVTLLRGEIGEGECPCLPEQTEFGQC